MKPDYRGEKERRDAGRAGPRGRGTSARAGRILALAAACLIAASSWGQAATTATGWREAGDAKAFEEEWYGAIECYLAALAINPSYYEAVLGLARSYYELAEYDQALKHALAARRLKSNDPVPRDLEGFVRIGLGQLAEARALFKETLAAFPNDLDARFGLAILDVADGRTGDARARFEEALAVSPGNARALLSLALIAWQQGDARKAFEYSELALAAHSGEARVQYFGAYLAALAGDWKTAVRRARAALERRANYPDARALLAFAHYQSGDYDSAAAVAEESIAANRDDARAWFAWAMAKRARGNVDDALFGFSAALRSRPDDEIARIAMENLAIDSKPLEDPVRAPLAEWHFERARAFERDRLLEQALFEYRRGLRIDPYSARGRFDYARALRLSGFPARQLSELLFLKDIGRADVATLDLIDAWTRAAMSGPAGTWRVDQFALEKRPYRVAVFCQAGAENVAHAGGDLVVARYLKDVFLSSSQVSLAEVPETVPGFSEAFRLARSSGADYFLIVRIRENGREVQVEAAMHVARTGARAGSFSAYRAGNDRVRDASKRVVEAVLKALPPRAGIVLRNKGAALVSVGRREGVTTGMKFQVVRAKALSVAAEGIGFAWDPKDALGTFVVGAVDEEVCEGTLSSALPFDSINPGDELVPAGLAPGPAPSVADGSFPSLFVMLGRLR